MLHGHGVRIRNVVVAPRHDKAPTLTECWSRRYRCTECHAVTVVLPIGVLPRFLYSVFAIVWAFVLVAEPPVGLGRSDAKAYDKQGMNRLRGWTKPWPYRWRSLDRWRRRIAAWWPAWTAPQPLVVGLRQRAAAEDVDALLEAVAGHHARWGWAR